MRSSSDIAVFYRHGFYFVDGIACFDCDGQGPRGVGSGEQGGDVPGAHAMVFHGSELAAFRRAMKR